MSDLIDRQAAIEALWNIKDERDSVYYTSAIHTAIDAMEHLPSAQPERETGRWEMKPDPYGFFDEIPVCSECGCTTKMRETYKFCPNCGADMRGET